MTPEKIKALSKSFTEEVIGLRRHLHANPELSYQEFNTVKFVEQTLRSFGIDAIQPMATTGLVAEVKGKNPDKKLLRFARIWMHCQFRKAMKYHTNQRIRE